LADDERRRHHVDQEGGKDHGNDLQV